MEAIGITIVVLGIFHTIRIYLAGRAAKKLHPPMEYFGDSAANTDPWRWRQPKAEIGLSIEDNEQQSCISFPIAFNSTDYLVSIFGSLAYATGAALLLYGLYMQIFGGAMGEETAVWLFCFSGAAIFFGAVCFSVRQRVAKLIRTPNQLILQYTYGAFWIRSIRFKKTAKMVISTKDQGITDYEISQDEPYCELTIKKIKWIISLTPVKFYILVNPSQISWIRGGLMECFAPEQSSPQSDHNT